MIRKPKATPEQHAAQAPIRKAKRAANEARAKARMKRLLAAIGECPFPWFEYNFLPPRRWKFDMAWPSLEVAVEVDGGQWHVTGRDIGPECERGNEAAIAGWLVLHFTSAQIDGNAKGCADQVRRAFEARTREQQTLDRLATWQPEPPQPEPPSLLVRAVRPLSTPIRGSAAISARRHQ